MSQLKIAIQKKGRLNEESIKLLKECGLKISVRKDTLKTGAKNFPIDILLLRDDDIPQYVEQEIADVGILGLNEVLEKDKDVQITQYLGFSKCRLSLAVPRRIDYQELSFFQNKTIATSYPNVLSKFLKEKNINAQIEEITGSVEIAPSIGLGEGICDIVSTGSTLMTNGLKEVDTVMKSEAVLIQHGKLSPEKQTILNQLLFRIQSVQMARENKYILLNAPNDKVDTICDLLPGIKSPTVLPLKESGWSSIHSVVNENDFWAMIDKLKNNGAEGILVIPIEKMIG